MEPKSTRGGRRKMPITKIENKERRGVTFSKRRVGAFKKASELSSLCGTQMAVVIFNENGKAFTYGNPSVNAILDRFMNVPPQRVVEPLEAQNNSRVCEMQKRIEEIEETLKYEKQRGKILSLEMVDEHSVEEMNMVDLQRRSSMMEELRSFFEKERDSKKANEDLNAFLSAISNGN